MPEDDAGLTADNVGADASSASDSAGADATATIEETTDAGDVADSATLICPPGKGDCNGNEKDGCETNLNDPSHCGSCTNECLPTFACKAEICCLNPHAACTSDEQCCSGSCQGPKGCH